MIVVEDLVKCYGTSDKRSVDGVSFEIAEGEVFAFLGPNGAGKSTTAKILTTLMAPTSGRASVAGFDVMEESRKVRECIGYVAQNTGIDFFMTGRENLTLIAHLYHLKGAELKERVDTMLDYFSLTEVADQMCAGYSGGMQRKLDIATALLHRPKVLFLDEPTLGLDAQSRIDLWDYVRRLNAEFGVTVFLTTHYLDEADKLADRVGIIDDGQLQIVGTPSELKDTLKGDSIALSFDGDDTEKARPLLEHADFAKEVLTEDDSLRIYVDNGGATIASLIGLLSDNDIQVKSVTLARPTLDDVFIKFTGKSMDKVEEKVDPWWSQWSGGGGNDEHTEWKGNKWVNSDGSAKDQAAFDEWAATEGVADAIAEDERKAADAADKTADATTDDSATDSDDAADEDTATSEVNVSESDTTDDNKPAPGGDTGWSGNEWVNADGSPKDPEAMAEWLKGGESADADSKDKEGAR